MAKKLFYLFIYLGYNVKDVCMLLSMKVGSENYYRTQARPYNKKL